MADGCLCSSLHGGVAAGIPLIIGDTTQSMAPVLWGHLWVCCLGQDGRHSVIMARQAVHLHLHSAAETCARQASKSSLWAHGVDDRADKTVDA